MYICALFQLFTDQFQLSPAHTLTHTEIKLQPYHQITAVSPCPIITCSPSCFVRDVIMFLFIHEVKRH